jgi:hypothetical protein
MKPIAPIMPEMNGRDLANQRLSLYADIKTLFMRNSSGCDMIRLAYIYGECSWHPVLTAFPSGKKPDTMQSNNHSSKFSNWC